MNFNCEIQEQIKDSIGTMQAILDDKPLLELIEKAAKLCIQTYKKGHKIIIAGNGGSAADSQHFAAELVSKFYFDRPGLNAIALTTDTSILTAIANDYGYEHIFARQIQAKGRCGDVFIAISTSGNSQNIINALIECQNQGIVSIGLTGKKIGKIDNLCDICIKVPSNVTPRIQEAHIGIEHILCCIIEKAIFGEKI